MADKVSIFLESAPRCIVKGNYLEMSVPFLADPSVYPGNEGPQIAITLPKPEEIVLKMWQVEALMGEKCLVLKRSGGSALLNKLTTVVSPVCSKRKFLVHNL